MKKFLSTVLALVMALSLCVPAFAAEISSVDGLGEASEVEVTGETKIPAIKISVPTTGKVILNPYSLSFTPEGQSTAIDEQIFSVPQYVINQSDLKVKVSTKITGVIEGAAFSENSVDASETAKKVFLEYNYAKATVAVDATAPTTEPTTWDKETLSTTPVEIKDTNAVELDKKGGTDENALGFKFTGDATANPTDPWTTDNTVGATVAFTFALVANDSTGGGGGTTYGITSATCSTGTFSVASSAAVGASVTVTANSPTTGGQTATVTVVKDSDSSAVSVTNNGDGTFSFTMPAEAVTVTVVYA